MWDYYRDIPVSVNLVSNQGGKKGFFLNLAIKKQTISVRLM
jgi:hypothetical protein